MLVIGPDGHLTEAAVVGYKQNMLNPREVLVLDDHTSVCEVCRARLSTPAELERAFQALQGVLNEE